MTRHDIKDKKAVGTMSEAYPHLILDNFTSKVCLFIVYLNLFARRVFCLVGGTFMSYLLFFIIKLGTMCGNGRTSEPVTLDKLMSLTLVVN